MTSHLNDEDGDGDDGGGASGSGTASVLMPDWIGNLKVLVKSPKAWIVGTLVGGLTIEAAKRRLKDESAVELIVEEYIFNQLIRPFIESIYNAGVAMLDSLLVLLFGTNQAIGRQFPWGKIGIIDLPVWITNFVVSSLTSLLLGLSRSIDQFNRSVATGFADVLGIAAIPIVQTLWAAEIVGGGYLIWVAIQAVDVPGAKVTQVIKSLARPFVNILRRFR